MYIIIAVVLFLLVLFVFLYNPNRENFDVYREHDFGAYNVYKNDESKILNQPVKTTQDASLKARYDWSEKDVLGYNVYDKMYNQLVSERLWKMDGNNLDTYDTKFDLVNSVYNPADMIDKNPVQTEFNGQIITMAQAQY